MYRVLPVQRTSTSDMGRTNAVTLTKGDATSVRGKPLFQDARVEVVRRRNVAPLLNATGTGPRAAAVVHCVRLTVVEVGVEARMASSVLTSHSKNTVAMDRV